MNRWLSLIISKRGFAERPSTKKAAKRIQTDNKITLAPVVEIKLPAIGEYLMNVNVSTGQSDPKLLPESEYPPWIWSARGSCRAALKSISTSSSLTSTSTSTRTKDTMIQEQIPIISETEEMAKLKRMLRTENRKKITKNNSMLIGTN